MLRPQLIHAHFGRGGALALPIARALSLPLVVTFHGGDATKDGTTADSSFQQSSNGAVKQEAALIICVAEHIREALLARNFPAAKLKVIRYGIEPEADGGSQRPAERPYLLFVGRFVEKGSGIFSTPCGLWRARVPQWIWSWSATDRWPRC